MLTNPDEVKFDEQLFWKASLALSNVIARQIPQRHGSLPKNFLVEIRDILTCQFVPVSFLTAIRNRLFIHG